MATITVDTYLDGGTARTAGEIWNVNGCNFTIRTDSRVHANAPASMTGSLSSMTVSSSLGGSIIVDSTNVRWMAYDTGSGNVPAIGTSITQGAVSGYLLGVWPDYASAPTAVGAAMPATGYLKFREVTGGPFSAGALTGIGASAISADVTGWIEVALDSNTNFAGNELGNGVQFRGDWFYLDNTSGSRGQQISIPANGGGSGTHVFAVQIETSAGSNVYDWFPTAHPTLGAAGWTAVNMGTDIRSKFVESMGTGVIRIGSNGSVDLGYLPPVGCKVRIPNIFGRTVATASRAVNQVPGAVTRANIIGGNNNIVGLHCDFLLSQTNPAIKSIYKKFTCESKLSLTDNVGPADIDTVCIGGFTGGAVNAISMTRFSGGTVNNAKLVNSGFSIGCLSITSVDSVNFNNLEMVNTKARIATARGVYGSFNTNLTFTNTKVKGMAAFNFTNSANNTITNTDFVDRIESNTTTNTSQNIFEIISSTNITFDGLTFGENGAVSNCNPYGNIVNSAGGNTGIKCRNFGTRNAPLDCGSNASFYPNNLLGMTGGGETGYKLQRCYLSGLRNSLTSNTIGNFQNMLYEDIFATWIKTIIPLGMNAIWRKIGATASVTIPASNTGTHWVDFFDSDDAGNIKWIGTGPSVASSAKNYLEVTPNQGTGYVTVSTAISLDTLDDAAYSEVDYQFKGHTGFQNVNPTITGGSTGLVVYYQLDTGSGFGGTWIAATGANLSAETVSPTGFKMKIKILQTSAVSFGTAIAGIKFLTTSTLAAQADNLYPLDTVQLGFTGLQTGSEVRCYAGTDPATSVEIGGTESTGGSTFSFSHSSSGVAGYIMIFAMGFQPIYLPYTFKTTDDSLLIQQVIDRNYNNPV